MNKKTLGAIIIVGVIIIIGGAIVGSYNSLASADEKTDAQWAGVENQLKRRADLIPNLVNTVKGFAEHEKDVLLSVTEARNGLNTATTPGELAKADAQLTSALKQLSVVVERYPDIKSNENFLNLQTQLEGTENRIAVARRDYNQSVKELNSRLRRFPTNIIAGIFGIDRREYFEVSDADKENPKVDF